MSYAIKFFSAADQDWDYWRERGKVLRFDTEKKAEDHLEKIKYIEMRKCDREDAQVVRLATGRG